MSEAEALADRAIDWLASHYGEFTFFIERDVVWTLQMRLRDDVRAAGSALRVFNDYTMTRSGRRSESADLVLISTSRVELAMEFKYEPSHLRKDIPASKFPVVFWGREGVAKDAERVRSFVAGGRAVAARSYFIDEGGHFARRDAHPGCSWVEWPGGQRVLVSRVP